MDSQQTKKLFDAVKNDNLNEFQSLILSNSDLNICFGRFPLLSVCYLYKSYKILNKYEKNMIGVKTYTIVSEYYEIYLLFKKYAKKSIRFFLNNKIVEPIQMLAVLDEREKIAKQYNNFYKNDEIVQKIEKIYSVTNSERVVATNEKFEAPRKKKGLKQQIYMSAIAIVLCLFMIFPMISLIIISSNSGLGIKSNPVNITSKKEFISALSGGKKNYTLHCDIYLDKPLNLEKFSGNFDGNNHKVILTEEYAEYVSENFNRPLVVNLMGTIKNLKIEINRLNLNISQNTSFFAENLAGNIENCEISGLIDAQFDITTDTYLSLFAINNTGKITNSTADVSISAINNSSHNAFLTAFVGVNQGEIVDCKSESKSFITDTVDVACFAMDNLGTIKNVENNLGIYQSSAKDWYPNTAGIVIGNNGTIVDSKNNGTITSVSTNQNLTASDGNRFVVYASGISVNNYGTIENCQNNGEILAQSINADIFSAGITTYNLFNIKEQNYVFDFTEIGLIKNCSNTGNVSGVSTGQSLENVAIYCSGIVALNNTNIENVINTGDIYCNSVSSYVYAGGVVGYSNYNNYNSYLDRKLINSKSECDISVVSLEKEVNVGGLVGHGYAMNINNSGFIGEIKIDAKYANVGGILGSAIVSNVVSSYVGVDISNASKEPSDELAINIATLVGFFVLNQNPLGFFNQNKCVFSEEYPALIWKQNNFSTIYYSTAEQLGVTVYSTVEELIESLES